MQLIRLNKLKDHRETRLMVIRVVIIVRQGPRTMQQLNMTVTPSRIVEVVAEVVKYKLTIIITIKLIRRRPRRLRLRQQAQL